MDGKLDQWKKLANSEVKRMGKTVDDLVSKTLEGIDIKSLYTAEDTKNLETIDSLPGISPFVRGPKATMYTARPWTIRQYAGFLQQKNPMRFIARIWQLDKKAFL